MVKRELGHGAVTSADREPIGRGDEMRAFLFVVRRALLLVVRWIENRYGWGPKGSPSRRERSSRD